MKAPGARSVLGRRQAEIRGHEREDWRIDESPDADPHRERNESPEGDTECRARSCHPISGSEGAGPV